MSRKANYPISDFILNRWSPRAMSGELLTQDELMTLFEAARWAPSSYNNQPWRFIYAIKGTPTWEDFFNILAEGNQAWCKNAAALVVVASKTTFDYNGKPSRTHSFDTGSAWENLALQGSINGLVVHGLQGFSYKKAEELVNLPQDHVVEMMIAIGKRGNKESLSPDLAKIESQNDRKGLSDIIFNGKMKN